VSCHDREDEFSPGKNEGSVEGDWQRFRWPRTRDPGEDQYPPFGSVRRHDQYQSAPPNHKLSVVAAAPTPIQIHAFLLIPAA
jgi:hypothetical protein